VRNAQRIFENFYDAIQGKTMAKSHKAAEPENHITVF
jgi:hypothetical protein